MALADATGSGAALDEAAVEIGAGATHLVQIVAVEVLVMVETARLVCTN